MIRLSALFCLLLCLIPASVLAQTTVFAAASLRDALTEIAASTETEIRLSFGGSGSIARQIASGAPADVVILAHLNWMGWLAEQGLLHTPPETVAGNRLVLVGGAGALARFTPTSATLLDALAGGRLAFGQRDAVPAGIYGREWLRQIGAWDTLVPHLAETDSVRAALALVATGAAPLGVVYASDALTEPRVEVLYEVPPDQHAPITYPAAAITREGAAFLSHLRSARAQAIFAAHGFAQVSE